MNLNTRLHTVFLLVGPSECGKSTFTTEVLIPQLRKTDEQRNFSANVQYISSDKLRQELLGADYHKYDTIMLESSGQAFDLLFAKLNAVTTFPIHAEFVVVDTTGLSEDFRQKVAELCKANHYHLELIVFDYKNVDEYYSKTHLPKKTIMQHVNRLRREVLASLNKLKAQAIHRIRAKDFYDPALHLPNPHYTVTVEAYDEYVSHFLPKQFRYLIIGDVHERVDALIRLLQKNGFTFDGTQITANDKTEKTRILLVGDWIDKGGNTEGIIHFLEQNREWFYLVKGNHENFVYKYLKGQLKENVVDKSLRDAFFTSIVPLQEDAALRERFFTLVESSKEFYRSIGLMQSSFIVTHAPCKNKYLGKIDTTSLLKQRNFHLNRDQDTEEQLTFVKEEGVGNHPYHLFGHVAAKRAFRVKNKIGVDSGAGQGHVLSSVWLDAHKPFFSHVVIEPSYTGEELPNLFTYSQEKVNIDALDDADQRRLDYILKHKINFISGTMSPADRDLANHQLESLQMGLSYYRNNGVQQVVLQPKYMGSRCNIYLDRDVDSCFAVSRNGYKVKQVDLRPVYEQLLAKFAGYMQENKLQCIILDGELMPWKALGDGLIEREFVVIDKAIQSELQFLQQSGFEAAFQQLVMDYETSNFDKERNRLSKKEMSALYGDAKYQCYKWIPDALASTMSIDDQTKAWERYHRQLEIYAVEGPLAYKPFAILKEITIDQQEHIPAWSTSAMFRMISDDDFLVVDFADPAYMEKAEAFYATLTTIKKMEGVVIKPEREKEGIAPFLKVRNPDYLTLIYGYDYQAPHRYKKLIENKTIRKKIETSIAEHSLGQKMLSFPLHNIHPEQNEYKQVVANMLFECSKEKEIDPRL